MITVPPIEMEASAASRAMADSVPLTDVLAVRSFVANESSRVFDASQHVVADFSEFCPEEGLDRFAGASLRRRGT